ncbi:uncharacterized protein [Temnothorax longispinosus]|uniref:uncharacterized protein n=1 Tax=Temnothorax longispinosus TaxID=300112 RepID=UPI003A99D13A
MSCKKGANWTDGETRTFLELVTEKSILSIIDGKKHRHVEIFRMLVPKMQAKGHEKTAEQMKLKLKNLKAAYFKCKRNNNVSGAAPSTCPFYNKLDILYGGRPSALASSSDDQVGIDTAEINEEEVNNENDSINCTTAEETDEMLDKENEVPPAKKQKRTKTSGRKSYEVMLQSHTDKWLENQKELLNSITNKQMELQKQMVHDEMMEQRKWEEEELEKERKFQSQQTSLILAAFTNSMQGIRSQTSARSTQSTLKPLKLIPVNPFINFLNN